MEEVDKKVLCYYILSYHAGLVGFDVSILTDGDVIKKVKRLEQLSYEDLLEMYNMLHTMFIEKFGIEEDF
uniref:Uncharacterized protein n=1 Tax=Podoviridae sp. ctack17 TaxID=2825260 RepID=A0A8S5PZX4_9CAUD|nr:MAG TPA: hypothetical protein [Podoviridae sp. ctack17]